VNIDFDQGTGLEVIGKHMLMTLAANINTELELVDAERSGTDQLLADVLEADYVPVVSESVPLTNFHHGHRPSLIMSQPKGFPNVSVISYQVNPAAQVGDSYDMQTVAVAVEIFAKHGPDRLSVLSRGEPTVNARIQRLADAAVRSIALDRTLGGLVMGLASAPSVTLTDVQVRQEDDGDRGLLWQGARIELQFSRCADDLH
jgi:hypothetical protein